MIFSFKTEGNLFAVFVGFPMEEFGEIRGDIERAFMAAIDLVPDFAARLPSGIREERLYGASDLPNFYRKPFGPGWALVGDAGLHKDPFLALGICDALRDAELLADAIGRALSSTRPMEQALADYETTRNDASAAEFHGAFAATVGDTCGRERQAGGGDADDESSRGNDRPALVLQSGEPAASPQSVANR